jgi:hypothetical protein
MAFVGVTSVSSDTTPPYIHERIAPVTLITALPASLFPIGADLGSESRIHKDGSGGRTRTDNLAVNGYTNKCSLGSV